MTERQKNRPQHCDVVAAVREVIAKHILPGETITVALSGGMDSASMLDAAAVAVKNSDWQLAACHINHGISKRADAWERFCRRLCDVAKVPLTVKRASPPPTSGGSEEWAREQRLRAFATLPSAAILAAHHSGDQAETVLFRLLRGAGSLGMSAMRHCVILPHAQLSGGGAAKMFMLRPWLDIPRARIAEYAKVRRLRWIEDEDNHNLMRRRNFLRLRVLPMIDGGGFDCGALLPVAARRFTDGASLLAALAQLDDDAAAADMFGGRGFKLSYFLAAGMARTRNWLHDSLRRRGGRFSERGMAEAARQILNAAAQVASAPSAGRKPSLALSFGAVALRQWRGFLFWDDFASPPENYYRTINIDSNNNSASGNPIRYNCPELGGVLVLSPNVGGGISAAAKKSGGKWHLQLRGGGEKICPPGRVNHRVADLLRESGVPPWHRGRLPFVYIDGKLAAIPGVAVAKGFACAPDECGWQCTFEWHRNR